MYNQNDNGPSNIPACYNRSGCRQHCLNPRSEVRAGCSPPKSHRSHAVASFPGGIANFKNLHKWHLSNRTCSNR